MIGRATFVKNWRVKMGNVTYLKYWMDGQLHEVRGDDITDLAGLVRKLHRHGLAVMVSCIEHGPVSL
jgi:hypothetical protein